MQSATFKTLRNLSISSKLTLVCLATSLLSLLIALAFIVAYDRYAFNENLKEQTLILASVISNRSSAAIVFDDSALASNNLQSLAFRKSITAACIYKLETKQPEIKTTVTLASYPVSGIKCPNYTPEETFIIDSSDQGYLEFIQPINLDGNIIGYLYLKSTLVDLNARRNNRVNIFLLVLAFSFIIAYLFSSFFSRRISKPLLALGKTATAIAQKDDYSIRAKKTSNDEVGQVVDSFNQMLELIEFEDASLRESEEKFRLISASSKVGIFQLDIDGNCIYANDEMTLITGLSIPEIMERNWLSTIHPDDVQATNIKWEAMLHERRPITLNCRIKAHDTKWINGHVSLFYRSDNEFIGFLGTINDITEVKSAQIQLEHMAFYDTLTGLANRRLFRNRLEHVINNLSREGNNLGLILLDLDQFKNINDSLGHDAGDTLLIIIAERLQQCVRASDTVARLGGDEFAIILPHINSSFAISSIAQKILDSLKVPIILQETEVRITVSLGISLAPEDSDNAESLVKNADLALYRAKDHGRDNYQFFTKEMNTRLLDHLALIEDLRKAIDADEFHLVYQPQVSIQTGQMIGMEALIRWESPVRGLVNPLDFISVAEETGLIIPLGRWVITTACHQLQELHLAGLIDNDVVMTVNLSVKQFQDEELVSFIAAKMKEFDVKPHQFEVELTESVLMENLDDAVSKLNQLQNLGVLVSIDDFGTGYSSLGYLKRLPVNILKVDRSFIKDIPHDKDDMEITSAVIAMAHNLEYTVVAEGVETKEQLDFLHSCRCDYAQGYFFSKPLSKSDLENFCKTYTPTPLN
jgi:diguanylate cyclase (GGDEF)-like protein/PAS domain S-box-containing protein